MKREHTGSTQFPGSTLQARVKSSGNPNPLANPRHPWPGRARARNSTLLGKAGDRGGGGNPEAARPRGYRNVYIHSLVFVSFRLGNITSLYAIFYTSSRQGYPSANGCTYVFKNNRHRPRETLKRKINYL